jgi:hypothetical protein
MQSSKSAGNVGDKLLPKIVHAVSQAIIATKHGLAPLDIHVKQRATQQIIDKIGHEIAEHYGPIADLLLAQDTTGMHPVVLQYLKDARTGTDQVKAIGGLLMGAGQGALGTFISNELAPFVYALVSRNPNLALDAGTASSAAAQRIVTAADAAQAAADQGYGANEAETLHQLAYSWPGMADAIDMRRRGFIDATEFTTILQRNAVPDGLFEAWTREQGAALSLADAALAYLRSDIDLTQAESIAAENGYDANQLQIFLGNVGEPPGEEQLAEAFRRKFIDQPTFERGIKQSRIRNEWIPTLVALRYAPMSVADAVNAVVQNHISMDAGAAIAQENGLEASAFPILYETAGEPLSRTELEQLYNRGIIPESVVEQGLAESRLKNKYIPDAVKLHERLLEPRMLSSAVETGAISHDAALAEAMAYGFSQANAEVLVNEGSARKLQTYRDRVVSAAEGLYEENAITQDQFTSIAAAMGFDANEAMFVYQSAEYRRQAKAVTAVVNAVRSKYIGHHINHNEASGYLDSLGLPSAQRDYLLQLWDIEAAANVRNLTPAQIIKATSLSLIMPDDATSRLEALGYSASDAALLLGGA